MDPVTTALIAAIVAGVTRVGEKSIVDSYNVLKNLIAKKIGSGSDLYKAIKMIESKPDSTGRKEMLKEEVKLSGVDCDPELLAMAQNLIDKLNDQQDNSTITQQATGNNIAQASHSSTASVNVNKLKS